MELNFQKNEMQTTTIIINIINLKKINYYYYLPKKNE